MTHPAALAAAWSPAEDETIVRARRNQLSASEIAAMLPGRTPQGVQDRIIKLRQRGVEVAGSRRGRPRRADGDEEPEFGVFRAQTSAASSALLAAITAMTNRERACG